MADGDLGMGSKQVAGDEIVAVALRWVFLAAQEAGGQLFGEVKKLTYSVDEPRALHYEGIINLTVNVGGFVRNDAMEVAGWVAGTSAQGLAQVDMFNTSCQQGLLQGFLVELRVEAAVRPATYIHQPGDSVACQQPDELVDGVGAVADGVQKHRSF